MSGGGSAPSSQTVTQTTIPEYLRPQVEEMIGMASGLMKGQLAGGYQPYEGQRVAGFTPMQAQAFQQVAGQQVAPQLTDASNIALGAGQGAMGYGSLGANYGALGTQYGNLGTQYGASGAGYGALGSQYGALGAEYGALGSQYGAEGAGYGRTASKLGTGALETALNYAEQARSDAQRYGEMGAGFGQKAADIAPTALKYGETGAGFGAKGSEAAQKAKEEAERQADEYGRLGVEFGTKATELAPEAMKYGEFATKYGEKAAELVPKTIQYGNVGLGFGQQAAGLAPEALGYGKAGLGFGAEAAKMAGMGYGAGQEYQAQATSPEAIQAYMSPYMQAVVAQQQRDAIRQANIQRQVNQAQAVARGAYGGSRQGIVEAELQKNLAEQLGDIQAAGAQQAFQEAQQAQQYRAGLGLQGLQAGTQAQLAGIQGALAGIQGVGQAGQMYSLGMQGAQTGLQGIQQAANLYGIGTEAARAGMQGVGQAGQMYGLGMQGAGLGLQGTGQRLAAGQLGLQGYLAGMQGAQTGIQGTGQAGQLYGVGIQGAQAGLQGVAQQIAAGHLAQQGYQNAMQGQGLGIQGSQAGMQGAGLGIQGAQAGMQGAGLGIQGAQAGMQGAGLGLQGAQTGISGAQAGIAGSQAATGAAGQLGALGGQQFSQQMAITDALQKYGALQQAQQQQALDVDYQNYMAAQNFPYQQLGFFSDIIRGLPMSQSTQTMYGGQPSMAAQIPGMLMAGAGYFGGRGAAEGGRIQKYAGGGSVSQEALTLEDARALPSKLRRLSDTQLAAYARTVKDAVTLSSIQSELQRRAQARQPYNPNATLQPTMADQVVKRAEAASIGGTGMAGGGIVALQGGGTPLTEEQRAALRMAGIPESVATADRSLGGFFRNLWQGVTANPAAAGEEMEKAKATAPRLDPNVPSPHDAGQMDMVVTPPPARAETPPPQEKTGITGAGQQNIPPAAPPQERAGIMQASRAAAGPMSYEEWQKQAAPKGFSEEDQAVLNDMRSKIAQKMERAGKQSDRAIYDSIMMAGLAMMGGNSLADGLMKAAQMGGATFMTSKDKATKAMEAAEEADLAFNKYKLELSKGNKKEARESFDDYMKYVVDLKKMDTQRDVATIQASARGGAGASDGMTITKVNNLMNGNADYRAATKALADAEKQLQPYVGTGIDPEKSPAMKDAIGRKNAALKQIESIRNNYRSMVRPEDLGAWINAYGAGNLGKTGDTTTGKGKSSNGFILLPE